MKSRIATIIVFLIAIVLVCLSAPLWADDGHGHNHGGDTNVKVGGDTLSLAGGDVSNDLSLHDSSNAFGLGLGDVDINDCYRSYQVLIWQDSKANLWCMANDLDARGLHDAAAKTRCKVRTYRSVFDSDAACIAASTMRLPDPVVDMAPRAVENHFEEEEEYHEEQQMLYIDLQAKIANLEQEQSKEQARRRAAQKAIEQQQQEQREYAQQALEELAEWK